MDFYPFDDEYVRRLIAGDRETMDHFTSYFGGLLLATLRRNVRSKEDIEDLRQEVFTRVLSKLPELQDSSKLGAFVYSFYDHVFKEWLRKKLREGAFVNAEIDVSDDTDRLQELIDEESRRCVREILGELPPHDAELLRQVFFEEADKDEICRRLGVDREYLRVLIHRAKKRFRELYCGKKGKPPKT